MPGFDDDFEVFRGGIHTAKSGMLHCYGEKELDSIVQKYNESQHEAPIVIGHPDENAPAYGWIDSLSRVGNSIFAKAKNVVPEFSELVAKGLYKKRSISLYPDLTLRHVGFLGAVPPAIKGLQDIQFSENLAETFEFSEFQDRKWNVLSRFLRAMREFLIDKYDTETADKIVDNWDVETIAKQEDVPTDIQSFSDKTEDSILSNETQQKLEAAERQVADFSEQLEKQKQQISELQEQNSQLLIEKKKTELTNFCEQMISAGKMRPADKDVHIELMQNLSSEKTISFSEGKQSPLELYKSQIQATKPIISFSEVAMKGSGPKDVNNAESLAKEVRNYMDQEHKQGRVVTYTEAISAIKGVSNG